MYYNVEKVDKMTEQNRTRYIIRQIKHSLRTGKDIERARELLTYQYYDFCWCCRHNENDYCGLRGSGSEDMTDDEIAVRFCFKSCLIKHDKK